MTDTAFLIIDVQKGLFNRKVEVHRGEDMLTNICTLIDRAHEAGAPIFFVRQTTKNSLAKGSENWQLHSRLKPLKQDIYIEKRYASAFKETDLKQQLDKRKIKTTVVAGLATHQCIKSTCLEAKKLGLEVILVKDGHSSFNRNAAGLIDEWNAKLSLEGVVVKMAKDIQFAD